MKVTKSTSRPPFIKQRIIVLFLIFSPASSIVRFDGSQYLRATGGLGSGVSEAEDIRLRFRTVQSDAMLVATRDDSSADALEIALGIY